MSYSYGLPRIRDDELFDGCSDPSSSRSGERRRGFDTFLRDFKRKVIAECKHNNGEWLADQMEASLLGLALLWYFGQDDDARAYFTKLRIAMLAQFGGLSGGSVASTQEPPQEALADSSPTAAAPPRSPPPPPPNRRGRIGMETWEGDKRSLKGYLARKTTKQSDTWVFEIMRSAYMEDHLIIEIVELPDNIQSESCS